MQRHVFIRPFREAWALGSRMHHALSKLAGPHRLQGALRAQPALQHLFRGGEAGKKEPRSYLGPSCCRPAAPATTCCRCPEAAAPRPALQLYALFGKYGAIRQIRLGSSKETRGTAYVVYEDIFDAKTAVDHLSGFNVQVGAGPGPPLCRLVLTPHPCFSACAAAPQARAEVALLARAAGACAAAAPAVVGAPRRVPCRPPTGPAPTPCSLCSVLQNRCLIILYYNWPGVFFFPAAPLPDPFFSAIVFLSPCRTATSSSFTTTPRGTNRRSA